MRFNILLSNLSTKQFVFDEQDCLNSLQEQFVDLKDSKFLGGISPSNFERPFEEFPLILLEGAGVLSEEFKNIGVKFDLIVFDKEVCKYIHFTKENLIKLFDLTFDNSSIIVIDPDSNKATQTQRDLIRINNEFDKLKKLTFEYIQIPKFNRSLYSPENNNIIIHIIVQWFRLAFGSNINSFDMMFSYNNFSEINEMVDDHKQDENTTVIFNNFNVYHSTTNPYNRGNPEIYLYFFNTKTILLFEQ
jgi:hypothetical protein